MSVLRLSVQKLQENNMCSDRRGAGSGEKECMN